VHWSNIYNAQLATYVNQSTNQASEADQALSKIQGGTVSMAVASCDQANKVRT